MNIFRKIFSNKSNDKEEVITMTNTEKALALINTFATGDTEKASELLAEGCICRLGFLPCFCSGKNNRKQYSCFRGRRQGVLADGLQLCRCGRAGCI